MEKKKVERAKPHYSARFPVKPGTEKMVDKRVKDPNDIRHLVKAEKQFKKRTTSDGYMPKKSEKKLEKADQRTAQ